MEIHKPFLKWVGGKTQIIQEVMALFPREMNNYYEPFVGGGSVLFALLSHIQQGSIRVNGVIYASDINPNLIRLYRIIQCRPEEFITEMKRLKGEYEACTGSVVNRAPTSLSEAKTSKESYYYWTRGLFNGLDDEGRASVAAAAMMLFLNKTCFRGVYRENRKKEFNVPFGNNKNPSIIDEHHIRATSELIQNVVFTCEPVLDPESLLCDGIAEDDFAYFDPPYAPENATSFVGYNADGFNLEQHKDLFEMLHNLGGKFLMSNADVPLVKEAFPAPAFTTKIISCRRAIHSKNPSAKTNEVLITN